MPELKYQIIEPNWNIPNVKAFTVLAFSLHNEPVSFDGLSDIGLYNRKLLETGIKPKYPISWLKQIHSKKVIKLPVDGQFEADGSYTNQKGVICEVITADCLPIVFANLSGSIVGIVHAGRRGLYKNIISVMFKKMGMPSNEVNVWIGPGISQKNYTVSKKIKEDFIKLSNSYSPAFQQKDENTFLMDLIFVAKNQLKNLGVFDNKIFGGNFDTYPDTLFHSARRDRSKSGRMVTVVWIND